MTFLPAIFPVPATSDASFTPSMPAAPRIKQCIQSSLSDVVDPQVPVSIGCPVEALAGDLSRPGVAERVIAGRPDVIFHL
ncbi:MAG: hypothetical protein AAGF59_12180, partial [Pseudomonadota bacterium]